MNIINNSFLINNRNNYENHKLYYDKYIIDIKSICVHLVTSSGSWFKLIFTLNRLIKHDFTN